MKKIITGLATFTAFIFIQFCSTGEISESHPYGIYHYRSYNFLGDIVGEGTIYINRSDSNMVTGNWNIRQLKFCLNCGRQFGSGYLEGYIDHDTIVVNLNPLNTEIDTKLTGVIDNEEISGDWRWVDRQGFGFSGKFTAIK